ncbi:MAG: CinA family nicotinamide mononucleotide deamidase-related protein [Alteromonadaceae bacterium]|nr:CinA family nicotinamide mononucleotide deamidase-related protein [Alteromonadaceae bacterium]
MDALKVQLLLTGNEIMSGDVIDSNSAMTAQFLKDIGIEVQRKVTVGDELNALVHEIKTMSQQADILIINGGLGPTVDDMTAQALALAANKLIVRHPQAMQHLEGWCQRRNYQLSDPNKKQADLPQHCEIIANSVGSAVGFKLRLNNCGIYCTPGVPSELKLMLEQEIIPELSKKIPDHLKISVKRMQVFGIGESNIQKMINENFLDWPNEIELGFRAAMPLIEVKLTARNSQARKLTKIWQDNIKALLGDHIIGDNSVKLNKTVVDLLTKQQQKITIAESCTGGLIASQLTQVAGASQVFEAGFVTYSNSMKTKLLSVDEKTLNEHGAVSKQTVIAMAKGALEKSQANYVIAVSGIAGPEGGTTEKPVGIVWIAWGNNEKLNTCCLYLPGNRHYFQHYVAAASLDLIRRMLISSTESVYYLKERQFTEKFAKKVS